MKCCERLGALDGRDEASRTPCVISLACELSDDVDEQLDQQVPALKCTLFLVNSDVLTNGNGPLA